MSDLVKLEELATKAFEELKSMIVGKDLDLANIVIVASSAMKIVEHIKELDGPQKKQMVVELVNRIVDELVPEDKQDALKLFIQFTLPTVIDQVIAATKGKMDINVITKKASGCFSCLSKE